MQNGEGRLVEIKGRHIVIDTCHTLKPIVELEVDGLQEHVEKVLRGEPKVKGDRREMSHREARHPPPEYHVGIVENRIIPRIIDGEKLENV